MSSQGELGADFPLLLLPRSVRGIESFIHRIPSSEARMRMAEVPELDDSAISTMEKR
jgi:hypothetical protein